MGENWILKSNGLPPGAPVWSLGISGNNFLAGTWLKGIQISSDYGENWEQSNIWGETINKITVDGNVVYAGSEINAIYISNNNGIDWSEKDIVKKSDYFAINDILKYNENIFVGGYGGICISPDNGNTWSLKNQGLTNLNVISLSVCGEYIYSGTNNGIFRARMSDLITNVQSEKQENDQIQIYPNPSSNILNLNFDNSNINLSNIKIYSLYGNEIQLNIKSISENNIEFDVSSLPQGVYFVNVRVGDKVERMKFLKINN